MKFFKKTVLLILVFFIVFAFYGYYVYQTRFGDWEIKKTNTTDIAWSEFIWSNQVINGKYYDKTAMLIPCKIEGIKNNLTFQFDTGSNLTMLYGNSLNSFFNQNIALSEKVMGFDFPVNLYFSKSKQFFKDLEISFGDYKISNKSAFIKENYGSKFNPQNINKGDTIHIGTIGADIFRDKILIIDYPKQKFAICDEMPEQFKNSLTDIELDKHGRPILPLLLNSKKHRILFDNGSSLFPIITSTKNIDKFSQNPILDSIEVSSWGKKHIVDSRMITDTFNFAGKDFFNVKIYENHAGLGIDKNTDAMAGNALFWNNTLIIDFKNKKIAIH